MAFRWLFDITAVLAMLTANVGNASDIVVIELGRSIGPGGVSRVLAVAPNDAQTRRKIRQGNHWAVSMNTSGLTHATGAVQIADDGVIRVFLVDAESQKRLLGKYKRATVLVDANSKE